jgi:hypothetical protein
MLSQGYQVPELFNPADFYIQTLAVSASDPHNSLRRVNVNILSNLTFDQLIIIIKFKLKMICDSFQQSPEYSRIKTEIFHSEANQYHSDLDYATKFIFFYFFILMIKYFLKFLILRYKTGRLTQIRWLYWRQVLMDFRNPVAFKILFFQQLVMVSYNYSHFHIFILLILISLSAFLWVFYFFV